MLCRYSYSYVWNKTMLHSEERATSPSASKATSELPGIVITFDSPSRGRSIRTTTSSKGGRTHPTRSQMYGFILHLETKNSKSTGLLLMKRIFDKLRALPMPAETILAECTSWAISLAAHLANVEFVWDFASNQCQTSTPLLSPLSSSKPTSVD